MTPFRERRAGAAGRATALAALALGGCSLAPQLMPLDAGVPDGVTTYTAVHLVPAPAVGVSRGFGERLEVGLRVETAALIDLWAKHTLLDHPDGLAVAVVGGASGGPRGYDARAFHAGPLVTLSRGRWTLTAGAQHNWVDYEAREPQSFGTDELGIRVRPEDDLRRYWQTNVAVGWRSRGGTLWRLGASCDDFELSDPDEAERRTCRPIIGVARR